jgi:hypothetical protein
VDDEAIDYAVSTVVIAACGRNWGGLSDDGLSLGIAFKGERIASPGAAEPSTTITEVERQFTIVA